MGKCSGTWPETMKQTYFSRLSWTGEGAPFAGGTAFPLFSLPRGSDNPDPTARENRGTERS